MCDGWDGISGYTESGWYRGRETDGKAACGRYWKETVREVYIREEYKRYRVFKTDQQSPRNIGPDSAGRKMVDMSEIYKNKKREERICF